MLPNKKVFNLRHRPTQRMFKSSLHYKKVFLRTSPGAGRISFFQGRGNFPRNRVEKILIEDERPKTGTYFICR